MAKLSKSKISQARSVLLSFSKEELTRGVQFRLSRRYPKGHKLENRFHYSTHTVKPVKINKYILEKIESGIFKLSDKTAKQLLNFERRYKYSLLRSSGLNKHEAEKKLKFSLPEVVAISKKYYEYATSIAEIRSQESYIEITPEDVLLGMPYSFDENENDWEEYITARKSK